MCSRDESVVLEYLIVVAENIEWIFPSGYWTGRIKCVIHIVTTDCSDIVGTSRDKCKGSFDTTFSADTEWFANEFQT